MHQTSNNRGTAQAGLGNLPGSRRVSQPRGPQRHRKTFILKANNNSGAPTTFGQQSQQTGRPPAAAAAAAPSASVTSTPSAGRGSSPPPPSASAAVSTQDLNSSLVAALAQQFRRESLPWIQDLVVPLVEGPPRPLTDTLPPERLADRDSRFMTVHGVRLHYKMALPGEREGGWPAAPSAEAAAGVSAAAVAATSPSPLTVSSSPSSRFSLSAVASSALPAEVKVPSWLKARLAEAPPSPTTSTWDPPLNPNTDPDAAPTLLLMHGLNGSTFSWRLLMDDLAAYISPGTGGCRVIAYDRPPYGLSQRPLTWQREEENPYTLEGGSRLAAGLLDKLLGPPPPPPSAVTAPGASSLSPPSSSDPDSNSSRVGGGSRGPLRPPHQRPAQRAVLVGHSAGAAVAVETALRYPERVCGLVLISPAISTDSRGFLARADLGQLLRFAWTRALLSVDGPGLNYVRRQVLRRKAEVEAGRLGIYSDEREVSQEVIDGYLRPLRARDWDVGTLLVYRALQVSGAAPPLERLRVPVLVLQGREDQTVPLKTAQAVADALRRRRGSSGDGAAVTELVVLEGCGHVPMDEQPLQVLGAVTDFVNRHCCGGSGGGGGGGGSSQRRRQQQAFSSNNGNNNQAAVGAAAAAAANGSAGNVVV